MGCRQPPATPVRGPPKGIKRNARIFLSTEFVHTEQFPFWLLPIKNQKVNVLDWPL